MSQLLSALPVGALVKDTGTVYNGSPIIWQILEHGHSGDPVGSTTLQSRDVLMKKAYDGKEPNSSIYDHRSLGNDRYLQSNILQWLNSNGAANSWYSAQHSADTPPEGQYVNYNDPYVAEKGFLNYFSSNLLGSLLQTEKASYYNDGMNLETVTRRVFLLSKAEVGFNGEGYYNRMEGTVYAGYSSGAVSKIKQYNGSNAGWRLRTYKEGSKGITRTVPDDGRIVYYSNCYVSTDGIAPGICIPSSSEVSDTTDADGAYTLIYNSEPQISPSTTNYGDVTAPPSITCAITDPDGDSFAYTVKLNGATKTSGSATGTKTFAIDTAGYWPLMALGTNTITVQATDSQGATTSATYTMNKTNSAAPVPTTDLVNNTRKETSFYIGFQIGLDADGDSQTVVAQVSSSSDMSNPTEFSGVEKEVAGAWLPVQTLTNADVGARLRIQVTGQTVGDTIYVRLKDTDSGSGSPVYTSTYAIVIGSVLEFDTLPISRTEKPSLVVAYLNKTMPADATLTMYACNNANDGAPTWEPIAEGETHQFTNKTKTAQNWAVSVKTSITAGATAGEISVSAVGLGVL
jgi:hypothetical protein